MTSINLVPLKNYRVDDLVMQYVSKAWSRSMLQFRYKFQCGNFIVRVLQNDLDKFVSETDENLSE